MAAYGLGVVLRPAPTPAGLAVKVPPDVSGLELVNGDSEAVTLAAYKGRVVLVYFGYTRCPDVCPITMARLAKMYQDLGEPDGLEVVMITVDPEHDTPEVIGDYARGFDPSFQGLTGSNQQVANAARSFYIGYAGVGGPDFTHTDVVAVLDREGRLRLIYGHDKVLELERDLPNILADRSFG